MNKSLIGMGIVISLIIIGIGIYGGLNQKTVEQPKPNSATNNTQNSENKPTTDIKPNNEIKTLVCEASEFDENFGADCKIKLTITFSDDKLNTFNNVITYQFNNAEQYNSKFSSMENKSGSGIESGLKMDWKLNDTSYTYTINMSGNIKEMEANGWKTKNDVKDFSYDSMLAYGKSLQLNCK